MWFRHLSMRQRALPFAIGLLLVLGIALVYWNSTQNTQRELVFVVPSGTAQRLAAGEELQLFPDNIVLEQHGQDTLVIHNADSAPIQVGPYKIGPGQRFTQRFYNKGTYALSCSLHADTQLQIIVR